MTRTLSRVIFPNLLLGIALPLAGCISFGAKPPATLLTLSPATAISVGASGTGASARAIVLEIPTVPASLATARIPVQVTPTSIAYVPDAIWAEPPARLFARLTADTVTARTGRVVVSTVPAVGDPTAQLSGELRAFGIDAATRAAVVTFDAALARGGSSVAERRRFEARVPVTAIDAPSAGVALNDAANQVAAQLADWIGR